MRHSWRGGSLTKSYVRSCKHGQSSSDIGKRWLHISTSPADSLDLGPSQNSIAVTPDAKFEVAGGPSSLLCVSLSASQNLYTRSGTLVGLAGKAENTVSTLSLLEPFSRTLLRIPFLYQKIISTTPVTALISTKASNTAITVVHLDGTTDWMLAGRSLLAWSGQTLSVRPTANLKMNIAHWGSSEVTGRGLLALIGQGSVSEIDLKPGESYIIHPSNVVAYTINPYPPLPYRFKPSSFRLQVPNIASHLPDTRFFKAMKESVTWRTISGLLFAIRTWTRRTLWGDRLFLQFHGPTTILIQTRASRISDVLTSRDINEIADVQPGLTQPLVTLSKLHIKAEPLNMTATNMETPTIKSPTVQTASIGKDGKISFDPTGQSAPSR